MSKINYIKYSLGILSSILLLCSCEIITRSKVGQTTTSEEYFFNWYCESDSYRYINIKYGKNSVTFIDQIFITDNMLACFMDGSNLTFYGQEAEY